MAAFRPGLPAAILFGAFAQAVSQPAAAGAPQRHGDAELVTQAADPAQIADRILASLVEVNGVPGMATSVWKDGALLWAGQAGYRNAERRLPVIFE